METLSDTIKVNICFKFYRYLNRIYSEKHQLPKQYIQESTFNLVDFSHTKNKCPHDVNAYYDV